MNSPFLRKLVCLPLESWLHIILSSFVCLRLQIHFKMCWVKYERICRYSSTGHGCHLFATLTKRSVRIFILQIYLIKCASQVTTYQAVTFFLVQFNQILNVCTNSGYDAFTKISTVPAIILISSLIEKHSNDLASEKYTFEVIDQPLVLVKKL